MASDDDINEVLGLRCRQPRGMPKMRVSARDLQNSGLLVALPEFLSQLAHGDLIASAAKKAPEAPEETLPTPPSTARPTPTPNSPAHYGRKGSASVPMSWQDGLGIQVEDEADKCPFSSDKGSRKRKASSALEPSSTSSTLLPCKVRLAIQYYPPLKLERFDLALGTTVVVDNPAARDLSPDPFAALQVARRAAAEAKKVKTEDEEEDDEDVFSPALPASPRIIKIKVPPRPGPAAEQLQQQQQQQELLTPPPTSPPVPSSPPPPPARRIIKLRDPRWSPAAPGSGVVRIKVVRKAGGLAAE